MTIVRTRLARQSKDRRGARPTSSPPTINDFRVIRDLLDAQERDPKLSLRKFAKSHRLPRATVSDARKRVKWHYGQKLLAGSDVHAKIRKVVASLCEKPLAKRSGTRVGNPLGRRDSNIRIAATPGLLRFFCRGRRWYRWLKMNPDYIVEEKPATARQMLERIAAGDLDLALATSFGPELLAPYRKAIRAEELSAQVEPVVVVDPSHPLARLKRDEGRQFVILPELETLQLLVPSENAAPELHKQLKLQKPRAGGEHREVDDVSDMYERVCEDPAWAAVMPGFYWFLGAERKNARLEYLHVSSLEPVTITLYARANRNSKDADKFRDFVDKCLSSRLFTETPLRRPCPASIPPNLGSYRFEHFLTRTPQQIEPHWRRSRFRFGGYRDLAPNSISIKGMIADEQDQFVLFEFEGWIRGNFLMYFARGGREEYCAVLEVFQFGKEQLLVGCWIGTDNVGQPVSFARMVLAPRRLDDHELSQIVAGLPDVNFTQASDRTPC